AGSAAVGADLGLKAAAVVAVGAATAGVGFKSVQTMTAPQVTARVTAVAPKAVSKPHRTAPAASARGHHRAPRTSHPALKHAVAASSSSSVARPTGRPSRTLTR